ncbi:adenosylcobinamide-GDP ribazoletransferase [Planococcus sp. APC 3906]|uniref:adenosylcobinamide-GDP ribazoletransferase n=1 Tax=Planococcus sp. APC 3906 TaxID=3035194 RepID=UPI0025B524BC|nr:adenosylcobinamide-GDP ribazoletransferase [Planococcus sp. APC 3906]MDN3449760.1 adenosylcobinamide-GDP ribazoletransferase [Planococcus sp. APC 3906]
MRGHIGSGIALAFQFFSVVPVKKALLMEKRDITVMYMALPLLGAVMGAAALALAFLFQEYTDASPLLGAFLLVFFFFAATGGLHLDGLADTADAYFSYQKREKRLEIMGDPRIGAFGTMVLIFAVTAKIIVLAEVFSDLPLIWLVIVPLLSRTGLLILFNWTKSAKKDGLAAFFQQRAEKRWLSVASASYLLLVAALLLYAGGWSVAFAVLAVFLLFLLLYRRWCLRNFGGMTGDLFGAYVEGAEILLWTMCLFFI